MFKSIEALYLYIITYGADDMERKIVLLLIMVLILSLLSGCSKNAESTPPLYDIFETKHQRDDISLRIFDIYKCETEYAFYEIEVMEGIDTERAKYIIDEIDELINSIISYNEILYITKPTIIITQLDIKTGEDFEEAYCKNNTVVAKFEMLDTYEFTSYIIRAMSDIMDPWLIYGISGTVMNTSIDMNQLQAYYSNPDNLSTLDFIEPRFIYELNGENTVYAKETAIAYCKYIYDKYCFNSIVTFDPQIKIMANKRMKNEWLKSIGVAHIYNSIYSGLFSGYKFTINRDDSITILSPFAEYNIKMQKDERFLLTSVDNLVVFLYKNLMGVAELKKRLSVSPYYDELKTDEVIIYEIDESLLSGGGQTNMKKGIIQLNSFGIEFMHIHETVHFFFQEYYQPTYIFWYLQEGLACYLSNTATSFYTYVTNPLNNEPFYQEQIMMSLIYENDCNGQTLMYIYNNSQELEQNLMDYYLSHGGEISPLDDFNLSLYADAMSYALSKTYSNNLYIFNYYILAESYVKYLVNTYSLDQVIQANMDCDSFEEIFGKTFEVSFNEWKAYILK